MTRPRSGKWIEGLAADMTVAEAADVVLRARLKALEKLLPLTARRRGDDPEPVHQLRVATRRAAAALRLFRPCLEDRAQRRVRRAARRIRAAAAAARQADVLRRMAEERAALMQGESEAVMRDLAAWLHRRRGKAQRSIEKVAERYPARKLRSLRRRLLATVCGAPVERVEPDHQAPLRFGEFAAARLAERAAAVEEASKADLRIVENLHALRLEGKRLRYEMESVALALGPDVQHACGRLKSLQDRLGALNDVAELHVALDRRTERAPGSRARRSAAARLSTDLTREQAERTETFLLEWNGGSRDAVCDLPRAARSPNGGPTFPHVEYPAATGDAPGGPR